MDYTKLNGLRNIARALGINKLLTYPARRRAAERMRIYERDKPKVADFELEGKSIRMHVMNAFEWMRVQSFYEDQHIISAIKAHLPENGTFWDVGSSIGLYSNYLAKVVGNKGKVIAFEPEIRSREKLMANIALNNNNQIRICPVGLGKETATFKMILAEDASAGNHRLSDHVENGELTQEVQVYGADEYRQQENLPQPNVVKIDVEGFEEGVILGAKDTLSAPECKAVIVEVHFAILSGKGDSDAPRRIVDHLRAYGFKEIGWIDSSHLIAVK